MTPADAAAPEQSGESVVVTVLLVVPVVIAISASTEPDSAKSEVAAIVITVDLIIPVLPLCNLRMQILCSMNLGIEIFSCYEMITGAQRISLNCIEAVTDFTKESGFDCVSRNAVLQNVWVSPTIDKIKSTLREQMRPAARRPWPFIAIYCQIGRT